MSTVNSMDNKDNPTVSQILASPSQMMHWTTAEHTVRSCTPNTMATGKINDDKTQIYELVTLCNFTKFQGLTFPIVSKVAHLPKHKANKFCIEWLKAEAHPTHTFNERSSWVWSKRF
jgi:hypothetical protein